MRLSKEAGHHRDGDRQPRGDPATIPVVSGGPQAGSDPGLRIPLADFAALHEASPGPDCDDATQVVRELRMVQVGARDRQARPRLFGGRRRLLTPSRRGVGRDDRTGVAPGVPGGTARDSTPGKTMVHEEVVVGSDGPRLLTPRAPSELPII